MVKVVRILRREGFVDAALVNRLEQMNTTVMLKQGMSLTSVSASSSPGSGTAVRAALTSSASALSGASLLTGSSAGGSGGQRGVVSGADAAAAIAAAAAASGATTSLAASSNLRSSSALHTASSSSSPSSVAAQGAEPLSAAELDALERRYRDALHERRFACANWPLSGGGVRRRRGARAVCM